MEQINFEMEKRSRLAAFFNFNFVMVQQCSHGKTFLLEKGDLIDHRLKAAMLRKIAQLGR